MEHGAVLVHASDWHRGVPVRLEVFRRDDALDDPIARSGPMAADAEDAAASIRVLDSKDGVPIGREYFVEKLDDSLAGKRDCT